LVARLFSFGTVFGISALLALGGAPFAIAEAGQSAWSVSHGQGKRPQFRPWGYATRQSASIPRWRPQAQSHRERAISGGDRGSPYAAPMAVRSVRAIPLIAPTAARVEPGAPQDARFRPRAGAGAPGMAAVHGVAGRGGLLPDRLHAQFRPSPVAKRRSYEELQAEERRNRVQMARAVRPLPHPFRHPWPAW
jgi:hypothetical protein